MIDDPIESIETPSESIPGTIEPSVYPTTQMPLELLKAHPRNYRSHPTDQLDQLAASLMEHGQYRNIVLARDNTLLAGHGVALAAGKLGWETVQAIVLDIDPMSPEAIKIVVADNELAHMAEVNDRALTELLKEIKDTDIAGLLGTGYDEMQLAALLMVTRPASEIEDFDEAAQWVGMPEYEPGENTIKVNVSFRNEADREEFCRKNGFKVLASDKITWSTWWPVKEREDLASVRFEG